jgi:outer membrane protein OmpA-like peptidoglycan-associated protein
MRRWNHIEFGTILFVMALAGTAFAQDDPGFGDEPEEAAAPEEDFAASAEIGTSGAAAEASGDASGEAEYDPFEIGAYTGLMVTSGRSNTSADDLGAVAWELGGRLGLYPAKYFGVEAELGGIFTRTSNALGANIGTARFHAVAQVPMDGFTPFLVVGGGVIGGECSDPEGCDSVVSGREAPAQFHFGVGVKVPVVDHVHLRFDLRDNVVPRNGEEGTADHLPDLLVGLAYTFGGKAAPEPPSDRDGDGLIDDEDACPDEPASTPDGCPIRDRDGDGVLDDVDECPDEPGELPNGCPDLDKDGDGIPIPTDECPEVAGVEPDGCPDADRDKDGIPNDADECPDEPETKNGFEDDDGCPDEVPEEVKKFTGAIKGITFDFGKSTIRATSFPVLDEAVKVLETYPSLRLRISGHTDDVGNDEANQELSESRAQAVATYFVAKGIDEDRFETVGFGESKPVADNKTPAGRQENRRIEFEVITR